MAFTLATFNTYWLYDNVEPLERWSVKLPDGGLEEKIESVAQAIVSIGTEGPDIVALQEVENESVLSKLIEKLQSIGHDFKYIYCSDTLDPYTGQNVAVISKYPASIKPVTRLDQTTKKYIDAKEREKVGSLGKFLRVDIEVDGEVITIFNVHLKSRRGGEEATRLLRNVQAEIVRDLSRPRVEQGNSGSPSFTAIVGDMNDEPSTTPLDIMQGKRDTSYNLKSATVDIPSDEKWTYVHGGNRQQLDHILLSRFAYERMSASGITRIDDDVSDHDAVWATLDLTIPPPA